MTKSTETWGSLVFKTAYKNNWKTCLFLIKELAESFKIKRISIRNNGGPDVVIAESDGNGNVTGISSYNDILKITEMDKIDSRVSSLSEHCSSGPYVEVPHAVWSKCSSVLDKVFSFAVDESVGQVFVLGPLHKGPVAFSDGCKVYAPSDGELCGSDWKVSLSVPSSLSSLVVCSDDVCSEECSLEIIAPYLSVLFPNAKVCYLLATCIGEAVKKIVEIIRTDFPFSRIFISNNKETECAAMWKEAFDR
jgi:hypothetical protein